MNESSIEAGERTPYIEIVGRGDPQDAFVGGGKDQRLLPHVAGGRHADYSTFGREIDRLQELWRRGDQAEAHVDHLGAVVHRVVDGPQDVKHIGSAIGLESLKG